MMNVLGTVTMQILVVTSTLYKSILRSDDIDNRFRGGKR